MSFFIKVVLRGPTMSFGGEMVSPKWRGTNDFPTMSFVIGFLCSCLGIVFRQALTEVKALRDALRVHTVIVQQGRRAIDFQTAGTNYNLSDDFEKMSRVIKPGGGGTSDIYKKELLEDAKFDVILEVSDSALKDRLVASLKSPRWFPFLGRKSNHIAEMPFGGVFNSLAEACAGYSSGTRYLQHVTPDTADAELIKDYPLCEGDNRATVRYVLESRV
jgi:CRISPR-associated protein Cas5/CasD subtype I-E